MAPDQTPTDEDRQNPLLQHERDQRTASSDNMEGVEPLSDDEAISGSLDPEVLDKVERVARTTAYAVIRHESHAGPMPSPRDFALYDKVLPGTAQTIRDEFERNANHIRTMQNVGMRYQKDDNDRNRRVAERLVWGAFAVIIILSLMGHSGVAIAVAVTTVTAVITGFLKGRATKTDNEPDPQDDPDDMAE